jgi:hypothetical protein
VTDLASFVCVNWWMGDLIADYSLVPQVIVANVPNTEKNWVDCSCWLIDYSLTRVFRCVHNFSFILEHVSIKAIGNLVFLVRLTS